MLLLILFSRTISAAQESRETDSLFRIVSKTRNDSVKVKALNKLAFHYIFNDAQKASVLLKQSERIARRSKSAFGYSEMINFRGVLMDVSGNSDSAHYYFSRALQLSRKYHFPNLEVRSINNLGMVYWNQGRFNEALHSFFEALRVNETLPVSEQINNATCYNNIGLIYQELDLNAKALQYHQKAYEIRKRDNLQKEQAISLNNIGICYSSMGKIEESIHTFRKGLAIAKASGNDIDYCKILENLGNSLQTQGKFDEAIACYKEVLKFPELGPKSAIGVRGSLVAAYNERNQPKVALQYANEGLALIKANPEYRNFASHLYQYTAQSYYMLGDIKKGELYNRDFIAITQEVFSNDNVKQIAGYEIRYETAKKEKLLAENKAKLLQNQAETRQKNYLLIGVSIFLLFAILIGLLIFRQQKLKHSQLEQEHKLKTAIAHIETQNKLQEQRLSISRDLHDNIGAQLTFIISSVENIKYAFNISDLKLGGKLENISSFAKSTIVELRDTIWAMNNNAIVFEDLRSRILNFIEKAKDATDTIAFKFSIDENLSAMKLSSIAGMNIYRTIQEAVNNAVKYSEADEIAITVSQSENKINIAITDNGIGFDIQAIEKGNGLQNMQKRIADIEGTISITSHPTKGTQIAIALPTAVVTNK